ncbi:pilus assembly protein CpaF [Clostridium sp.]|uniref:pilus assembly protein CpaF n=1 Tax=Clostridium sp. TaxID=1506 RepID=UPI003F2E2B1F
MLNIILIILIVAVAGVGIYFYLKPNKEQVVEEEQEEIYKFEPILEYVKESFNNILKTNLHEVKVSKEEYEKRLKNKTKIRTALKMCAYGDKDSKAYIKDLIKDMLINDYKLDDEKIERIIPFEEITSLTVQDKFDILLYLYKKQYDKDALIEIFKKYGLDRVRNENGNSCYFVTAEEIHDIYRKEKKVLYFEDKINILVQRVYQSYKGFSVIDEIRDMNIDGVSGGVSGIPAEMFNNLMIKEGTPTNYESIWIFFKGKTVHLRFLSFKNENDLKRVCKNIYKYNSPGQLSESNGYKVNEMKDGSRVVVARPPFCESWVFFVRKLDNIKEVTIEELLVDENKEIPITAIKYFLKGHRRIAVTGQQGTGKTTFIMSAVKFIDSRLTLRLQEMAFELHLRKLYPLRNIVSFRETPTISGQEGLDLQKKTDGAVNILGEIAQAPVASWMIQMGQVASLFTIFTHHAITTRSLIEWTRNALLQCGGFTNEFVAEKQAVEGINFDIHLSITPEGHRYLERITEVVPVEEEYSQDYLNATTHEERMAKFMQTMEQYFTRVTNRKTFETRDIVVWKDAKYEFAHPISQKSIAAIESKLSKEDLEGFRKFLKEWEGDNEH